MFVIYFFALVGAITITILLLLFISPAIRAFRQACRIVRMHRRRDKKLNIPSDLPFWRELIVTFQYEWGASYTFQFIGSWLVPYNPSMKVKRRYYYNKEYECRTERRDL